jgi:sigma54-dependent transcription regulator
VTGAVYADTKMIETIGKGNGSVTGVCSARRKSLQKGDGEYLFLDTVPFNCPDQYLC